MLHTGFYRKSTAGHNTLTFNNDNVDNRNRGASDQDPGVSGITAIKLFEHGATVKHQQGAPASPAYAIVDLTAAYAKPFGTKRVERGFAFSAGFEQLVIVDEFELSSSSSSSNSSSSAPVVTNVTWTMHTLADITIGDGRASALLTMGGAELHVKILQSKGVHDAFSSAKVDLKPPQNPTPAGFKKLMLHRPLQQDGHGSVASVRRIVVVLSMNANAPIPPINPLEEWKQSGPFK